MYHNSDMEKLNTFSDRLRYARKRREMTQFELGKKSGLSQATISDIERGRNYGSTESVLLASILGVSPLSDRRYRSAELYTAFAGLYSWTRQQAAASIDRHECANK